MKLSCHCQNNEVKSFLCPAVKLIIQKLKHNLENLITVQQAAQTPIYLLKNRQYTSIEQDMQHDMQQDMFYAGQIQ